MIVFFFLKIKKTYPFRKTQVENILNRPNEVDERLNQMPLWTHLTKRKVVMVMIFSIRTSV